MIRGVTKYTGIRKIAFLLVILFSSQGCEIVFNDSNVVTDKDVCMRSVYMFEYLGKYCYEQLDAPGRGEEAAYPATEEKCFTYMLLAAGKNEKCKTL